MANARINQAAAEFLFIGSPDARINQAAIEFLLLPGNPAVVVDCNGLANGTVGVPYSEPVTASGGLQPYQFVVIGGSLPPGLTLDKTTGVVSGTPTAKGTFDFTIGVADSA